MASFKWPPEGGGGGGGGGTVESVAVISNNGITSSVTNPTTTPIITLGLGTITPAAVAAVGTITGSNLSGTNTGDQTITLTGPVTGSGTGTFATSVTNNAITNAALAQMAAHTYKGNNTGSTANAIDVTSTQLTADLNQFSSSLQGMTPASGGGTTNFLRADGTWAVPPNPGGTVTSVSVTTANGVSGTVSTPTSTPAISLTLGAITPTSVATTNGSVLSTVTAAQSTTGGGLMRVIEDSGAAMTSGNKLGRFGLSGATDASHTIAANATSIDAYATENWSGSANGSKLTLSSTPNTTTSSVVGYTLDQNGDSIFGAGEGATPSAAKLRGPAAAGSNVAGANLTVDASNGTGTGGSGPIIFRTAPTGSTGSTPNTLAEAMRVTPTGRLGIGTNNPAYALTVQAPQNTFGIVQTDGTVTGGLFTLDGTLQVGLVLSTFTNHPVRIATNNSNAALHVLTDNVGIGQQAESPTSVLQVSGSIASAVFTYTSGATLDEFDSFALGDATSASFSLTIPLANSGKGREYQIFKIDSSVNTVTITMSGSDKVNGASTYVLTAQYKFARIKSDGVSNWYIIGSN